MQLHVEASRDIIDHVTRSTLNVLPLLRKRLLRMDRVQAEHGMPLSHIQVLAMLEREHMISVTGISQRLGVAKPNITPLVDRLIASGYVERQRDEFDRRIVNIVLLPKGQEKLDSICGTVVETMCACAGSELDEDDILELERALCTIEDILGSVQISLGI